jgi:hypothetical protein
MNCQTFSTGLSSGHLGGRGTMVMFCGMTSRCDRCHPVDEKHGMSPWCDSLSDLRQMQGHRCGIAPWQDERSTFALSWADGTEDVGRSGPLIRGRRWSCAAPGPATGDLVLLPNPGFVSEPDLYRGGLDALLLCDLCQDGGETYGMAPLPWQCRLTGQAEGKELHRECHASRRLAARADAARAQECRRGCVGE